MTEPFHRDRRDSFLLLAAVLTIIAGILSFINGVEGLLLGANLLSYLPDDAAGGTVICGVLLIMFGMIAIAGGLYAFTPRARLTPVLLGAGLGMLGGGVYGFILGLTAILLLWMANADF